MYDCKIVIVKKIVQSYILYVYLNSFIKNKYTVFGTNAFGNAR